MPAKTIEPGDHIDAERLNAAVARRFTSFNELARTLGVASSQVIRWRHGQRVPTGQNLIKLCVALGVSWAHLFRLEREPLYLELLRLEVADVFGPSVAGLLDDLQQLPARRRDRAVAELREVLRNARAGT